MTAEERLKNSGVYMTDFISSSGFSGCVDAVEKHARAAADKSRKEEREKIEKEINYYRDTLNSIASMAGNWPDTLDECHSLIAHIQTDAAWVLREREEQK